MKKTISIISVFAILFLGCSEDDIPEIVNEEEVITTISINLMPQTGDMISLVSKDLDGDGPNDPVITISGPLAKNTVYDVDVTLLNELVSPAEDITEEVYVEGIEHQFFYTLTNDLGTFEYNDTDDDDNPIGILATLTTAIEGGTGKLTLTLRHKPNKAASGVKDGDITNAGGVTDVEETFDVVVA